MHGEGDRFGEPYRLLDWQREFVWRWYELDPDGTDGRTWWYDEGLIGAERGAVKTELVAALGVLEFAGPQPFARPTPIVHIAAAAFVQAGELFRQAQIMCGGQGGSVPQAPLHGLFDVWDTVIVRRDGKPGKIERIAAVAGTNEGGKTTLFGADEVHEWTGRKGRVHTVVSAALTKRTPPGRALSISTAGAGRGSIPAKVTDPLLWRMYARGLESAADPTSRYLFDWREASMRWDLSDPEQLRSALREAGRAADVTWSVEVRARELEQRKIPEHEFRRYYLNQFVALAHDSWLTECPGAWEDNARPGLVPAEGDDVIVGVDMALHHDSAAVVVAWLEGDTEQGPVIGWWARTWAASRGRIDHLEILQEIRRIPARFGVTVRSVVYDPRFFTTQAAMLEDEGFATIEFPQSPERLVPADTLTFAAIAQGRHVHPDDPVLNAHAANAAWRESDRGRYLSKGRALGHMDAVRAGSMATYELLLGEEPAGLSVY